MNHYPRTTSRRATLLSVFLVLALVLAACQQTVQPSVADEEEFVPQNSHTVTSLTLINADTDVVIGTLSNGGTIDYVALGTQNISIRADANNATKSVAFDLDGSPERVENSAPYAIAGDKSGGTDYHPINPPLAAGSHTVTATPYDQDFAQGTAGTALTVTFTVVTEDPNVDDPPTAANDAYNVATGATLNVSAPGVLGNDNDPEGQPLTAILVNDVSNGTLTLNSDGSFTYTHDGGASTSDSFTYMANDGVNNSAAATVTITVTTPGSVGSVVSFTLINADTDTPVAGFDPIPDGANIDYGAIGTQNISIRANTNPPTVGSVEFHLDGSPERVENSAPYAIAGDKSGGTDFNPIAPPLAAGSHTVTATPYENKFAGGLAGVPLTISFTIGTPGGSGCTPSPSQFPGMEVSPLPCSQVKVVDPYLLEWDSDEGAVLDDNSVGTGFTMILPSSNGIGYLPFNLDVDTAAGTLAIETTAGLFHTTSNTQDNAVGVGIDLPNKAFRIESTLLDPPAGSGAFEQAGVWFGISEQDYIKLTLVSTPSGHRIEAYMEEAGSFASSSDVSAALPITSLRLSLVADPAAETVKAYYQFPGGIDTQLAEFTGVPAAWFSKDAAGIDFTVGTRSYGGIYTSHRNRSAGAGTLTYTFESFALTEEDTGPPPPPPPPGTGIDFDVWKNSSISFPTAMAWGPDNRLYVATATGSLSAFTFDYQAQTTTNIQTINTLGSRLALGLAIDPDSTPSNVILWVAHSDPSQNNGAANSGTISKLSGPGFATRDDVITGLPRAIANHAPNELGFGPDGRLYMFIGGNTGAGASNDGGSEFGTRPEQPLSAAVVVADVKAAGFDGSCTSLIDPDGSTMDATGVSATDVPCDVAVYASGMRNAYDGVWHSNGKFYATDNGLGVEGTFPDLAPDDLSWTPGDGCEGMIQGGTERTAHNPGSRTDLVYQVEQGDYFGHPNPSRGECVFFGGNPTANPDFPLPTSSGEPQATMDTTKYQVGVQPEATWKQAMFALGKGKSANSIIEYTSDSFCGQLKGDLLITYYSQDDQIRRLQLSGSGLTVTGDDTLIRSTTGTGGPGLNNPLPIAQDPLGRLYVGEFGGGGTIAVFDPIGPGCWQTDGVADAPAALLDAGGTAIGDRLYMVAGKTNTGHKRALRIYDAMTNGWSSGADLPAAYPAVENPAVVAVNGELYVFGGSTAPFSGAVTNAARYDPALNQWTLLNNMPTARGGASAQAIGGKIYVVGGMNSTGTSLATVDAYDIASGTWDSTPPASMLVPRDNPGSAAIGGKLYVFGGRARNVAPNDDTLDSAEVYDPATDTWSAIDTMPTGRRTMNVVVVDGKAVVMGGEQTVTGGTFDANEEYDPATDTWTILTQMPVGRHGAVAGRIGNGIFVAGGGLTGGSDFTTDVDVFRYK